MSSAIILQVELIWSFAYIRKRSGTNTDPCGTSDSVNFQVLKTQGMLRKTPLTLTLGVQLNYELISLTKKKIGW